MIDHQHFLEKLLADDHDYWIVAKENYTRQYFEEKRQEDDILLISVSFNFNRPQELRKMTIADVEKVRDSAVDTNIFFTGNTPPFQIGMRVSSFHDGFAITGVKKMKEFIIACYQLESTKLEDYRALLEQYQEKKEEKK